MPGDIAAAGIDDATAETRESGHRPTIVARPLVTVTHVLRACAASDREVLRGRELEGTFTDIMSTHTDRSGAKETSLLGIGQRGVPC